jgi:membrane protein DedA with SNARE-associated domain
MRDLLVNLTQWAVEVVYSFGYVGVFIVVALANVHLPIPTELTLPLAGFLVGQGRFSLVPVLVASTAGTVLGALAHYLPGLWFGEERLRRFMLSTLLGSILWNGAFIGLGWLLGVQWALVERYARIIKYAVLAVMLVVILWFLWHRWKTSR